MIRKQGILQPIVAVFACMVMLSGSLAASVAAQEPQPTQDPASLVDPTLPQETTPEATEETQPTQPAENEPASTPEATQQQSTTSSAQRVDQATTPGSPASLAHGLAFYDGDDLVWQVQEVKVPVISEANGSVSEPAIVIQREGQSIIRNDATGKRALLAPGEAFFITSEDSYTIMAEDDGSTIWKYTLVDPDDVASDAFYESPTLTSVRNGTYDFKLVRYVLHPGDTADLPSNSGAGLVMPGSGEVQVDHGGQLSLLGLDGTHGQGQAIRQPTSLSNTGSQPAVAYYLFIGDEVSEDSAAPAQNTSSTSSNTDDSGDSTSADVTPAADGSDTTESTDETTDEGSGTVTSPSDQPEGGPYLAQINIYAQTELYLVVTVDGTVWYDGTLPEGQWSGAMPGSHFEVYTSSGANTLFENACGTQFFMGEEPGEASYVLEATADSCPPPG